MKKLLLLISAAALLLALPAKPAGHRSGEHRATVIETMNAGGYTYMKVDENGKTYWVAVVQTAVKKGERVRFVEQMRMHDFPSRTLHRTFDEIVFAVMEAPARPAAKPVRPETAPKKAMRKADGGYSVEEVFARRQELKGKKIRVRGVVTKISRGIMKRDWVHIEDGTGSTGTDDLVFTSNAASGVRTGDTVVAEGTVVTDKDLGYGYFYPVLIENGTFAPER